MKKNSQKFQNETHIVSDIKFRIEKWFVVCENFTADLSYATISQIWQHSLILAQEKSVLCDTISPLLASKIALNKFCHFSVTFFIHFTQSLLSLSYIEKSLFLCKKTVLKNAQF